MLNFTVLHNNGLRYYVTSDLFSVHCVLLCVFDDLPRVYVRYLDQNPDGGSIEHRLFLI